MKIKFCFCVQTLIGSASAIIIYLSFGFVTFYGSDKGLPITDSTEAVRFQHLVDSVHPVVLSYTDWIYDKAELDSQESLNRIKINALSFQIEIENKFYTADSICSGVSKKGQQRIKEYLKAKISAIAQLETALEQSNRETVDIQQKRKETEQKIKQSEAAYKLAKDTLAKAVARLEGYGELKVGGVRYRFFIVNRKVDLVQIHSNKKVIGPNTFETVIDALKKEKLEPEILMNAGMYTPAFAAQGLLIENTKEVTRLDTTKPDNKTNFYIQPNGVFYIDSVGYHLLATDDYRKAVQQRKVFPQFATQSGPMLVIQGKKNTNLKNRSQNLNIRNGVGIMSNNKAVFLISDDPVNFYSFANAFQEYFLCQDALYLDGAISKMYVSEKLAKNKAYTQIDGSFGPIISVSKRKK